MIFRRFPAIYRQEEITIFCLLISHGTSKNKNKNKQEEEVEVKSRNKQTVQFNVTDILKCIFSISIFPNNLSEMLFLIVLALTPNVYNRQRIESTINGK